MASSVLKPLPQTVPLPIATPSGSRRHLALFLPRWATDCLKRADPTLAGSQRPLALWERQKGAMRLAAVDLKSTRLGLAPGQSVPDARAQVPDLELREIDRPWLARVFADFADWHSNASPLVTVLEDSAAYGDLVLDIAGVTHLFGGEARMLDTLLLRLRRLGFTVTGAIADTVGAAWALAHFAPGILPSGEEEGGLANLPVAALRLPEPEAAQLARMGLKTIGSLYGRDRKGMEARFGTVVTRLDQALGRLAERITPRLPEGELSAERRFAEPIGYIDDVITTARDLAVGLSHHLADEGLGAQTFHLFLYRVDHKVMTLSVHAARATRDPGHIAQLFAHRAERLEGEYDPGFGIDMIRLVAAVTSPLESRQITAFEAPDGTDDLARLYDRMTSRLGREALLTSVPVDTHMPERAARLVPILEAPSAKPDKAGGPAAERPLRLLPRPEEVEIIAEVPDGPPIRMIWRRVAYRIVRASGPERIEAEWWRSGKTLGLLLPATAAPNSVAAMADPGFTPEDVLRDYYNAEDDGGRRFWIFREGLYGSMAEPRWFLHGLFP
jgi:protein ImuB